MRDIFKGDTPFYALGNRLKSFREKMRESLAEVSGAVEIDIETLEGIEQGKQRPSEDILLLLISHFSIQEKEADRLWELAGFDGERNQPSGMIDEDITGNRAMMMVVPMDPRVVYTDMVHVSVNNFGVVMNFMQTGGPNNQPLAVSRIGMSREHAESVLEVLQKTLSQADQANAPKVLPKPKSQNKKRADKN